MSLKQQIVDVLIKPKTYRQILEALPENTRKPSVRGRLSELCQIGVLVKKGTKYRLTGKPLVLSDRVVLDLKMQHLSDELKLYKDLYRESLRTGNREDRIVEAIRMFCTAVEPVAPVPVVVPATGERTRESVIALISDCHWPEIVDPVDTGDLGAYDMDIATGYVQCLADKTIDITADKLRGYELKDIWVFLLGDMVTGIIHNLLQHNPNGIINGVLYGGLLLVQYLQDMCQYFENVHVVGVVGNHGRLQERKRYKQRYENWDYLLYNFVAVSLMRQPNISFCFPRSFWHLVNVENWNFLLMHGDDIRSYLQIPWYGILRATTKFQELLTAKSLNYDYAALGHFHNAGTLDRIGGEIILNGAMIGTTDFSLGRLFTGNRPTQWIAGVHPRKGVTWRYPIRLSVPDEKRYLVDTEIPPYELARLVVSD